MSKVSILIPSKDDKFLSRTIENIQLRATGDYEIIVILDGPTSHPLPKADKNLIYIQKNEPEGLRKAINEAATKANGKYLFKTDAHCMFDEGFDETLKKNCEDNWVVIPRRYGMDPKTPNIWKRQLYFQADYYYLTCPWGNPNEFFLNTHRWFGRDSERKDIPIDETMSMHGSAWFMTKNHFFNNLGGLETEKFGQWGENEEIALKTWLGGGAVMVNKKTWYAHLQMRAGRAEQQKKDWEAMDSHKKLAEYWTRNKWAKRIHDFDWLIDKFWPLPTANNHDRRDRHVWPENWKKMYQDQSQITELCELAFKYGSDKCPQIKHHYTPVYFDLFNNHREEIKKVVEIGVEYPETMNNYPNYKIGASLYMWRDFFPNAQIYGADILPNLVFKDDRIETFQCDQTNKEDLERLIRNVGSDIDLFIDDGSHKPDDQVFTCKVIMPLLKKDAIYVIEDIVDLGIIKKLSQFNCQYTKFRNKSSWDDRLIVIRKK